MVIKVNNNKILILLKESDVLMEKVFKYNFKNADTMRIKEDYTPFDREELATKINNNYKQVIFYDYYNQFYLLLPLISKKVLKKYIIKEGIGVLYKTYSLTNFQQIFEYKERNLIDFIATTRYDLYIAFSNQISYIELDYKTNNKKEKNNNSIGILNEYYLEESNFFNELSAIAITDVKKAIILDNSDIINDFSNDFSISIEIEKDIEKLIYKNIVNLDCKFCDVSTLYFLMSMDADIPCILGNTNILDNDLELKKHLVLDSDDDINEIKLKIEQSIKNKSTIMKLYNSWRKKYTTNSEKSIESFIKLEK